MTDLDVAYVHLLRRGPRTPPEPDWEAGRYENEVRYWAKYFDEFISFLPGLRRHRGNDRVARLVADVVAEIKRARGQDAAVLARDRLIDRWRDRREAVRPEAPRARRRG